MDIKDEHKTGSAMAYAQCVLDLADLSLSSSTEASKIAGQFLLSISDEPGYSLEPRNFRQLGEKHSFAASQVIMFRYTLCCPFLPKEVLEHGDAVFERIRQTWGSLG